MTEGFSNTLIGDFEQFTRVQERADLDKKHKQGVRRRPSYSTPLREGPGATPALGANSAAGGPGGGVGQGRAGTGFMGLATPFFGGGGHERGAGVGAAGGGYDGAGGGWSRPANGTAGGVPGDGKYGGRGAYESGTQRRGRREGGLGGADVTPTRRRSVAEDSRDDHAWRKDKKVKESFGNKLATAFRKMSSTKQVTFAI